MITILFIVITILWLRWRFARGNRNNNYAYIASGLLFFGFLYVLITTYPQDTFGWMLIAFGILFFVPMIISRQKDIPELKWVAYFFAAIMPFAMLASYQFDKRNAEMKLEAITHSNRLLPSTPYPSIPQPPPIPQMPLPQPHRPIGSLDNGG